MILKIWFKIWSDSNSDVKTNRKYDLKYDQTVIWMLKQTFSIFQIFAFHFPFFMTPHDARSSVTLERLGFVVREPQSHLELTYFLPKISAFMLISVNWANLYLRISLCIWTIYSHSDSLKAMGGFGLWQPLAKSVFFWLLKHTHRFLQIILGTLLDPNRFFLITNFDVKFSGEGG